MLNEFEKRIFDIVKTIPKGSFLTYQQVAEMAGRPKVCRAVGNILNGNYDSTVPCHRVIRSDGKIGGYNRGTNKKVQLLKQEGVEIRLDHIVEFDKMA